MLSEQDLLQQYLQQICRGAVVSLVCLLSELQNLFTEYRAMVIQRNREAMY
jgi:hypothetical protein